MANSKNKTNKPKQEPKTRRVKIIPVVSYEDTLENRIIKPGEENAYYVNPDRAEQIIGAGYARRK